MINDPDETHDIAHDRKDRIAFWRDIMVKELSWRNEGYVKDGKLQTGQQVIHRSLVWYRAHCVL